MVYSIDRKVKSSIQKANLVASLIRGKKVSSAIVILNFTRKRVAHDIRKVLFSAVANAQNNSLLDVDRLYVSKVLVGKARTLKRFHPRARGASNKINKHYSEIKVFLGEGDN